MTASCLRLQNGCHELQKRRIPIDCHLIRGVAVRHVDKALCRGGSGCEHSLRGSVSHPVAGTAGEHTGHCLSLKTGRTVVRMLDGIGAAAGHIAESHGVSAEEIMKLFGSGIQIFVSAGEYPSVIEVESVVGDA